MDTHWSQFSMSFSRSPSGSGTDLRSSLALSFAACTFSWYFLALRSALIALFILSLLNMLKLMPASEIRSPSLVLVLQILISFRT